MISTICVCMRPWLTSKGEHDASAIGGIPAGHHHISLAVQGNGSSLLLSIMTAAD